MSAFRVSWAPGSGRLGNLTLCTRCAEHWPGRTAANRAHFDGSPVLMTAAEVDALRAPHCDACGRVVLSPPPASQQEMEADWWAINDACCDELDAEPL